MVYLQPQIKTKPEADVPKSRLMLKLDRKRDVVYLSICMRVELRSLISVEGRSIYESFSMGVVTAGWLFL